MRYLKTYEGLFDFFKKRKEPKLWQTNLRKPDYGEIINSPEWLPSENNAYWKEKFKFKVTGVEDFINIELIMKFSHKNNDEEFVFNGIWKDGFDWSNFYGKNIGEYVTKQESAIKGDKSKDFSFSRGRWFSQIEDGTIVKATKEEIEFYDLHAETNKYNL